MERKKFLDRIAASEGKEKLNAILDYSRYLRQIDPSESIIQARRVFEQAVEINDHIQEISALVCMCNAGFYNPDIEETESMINQLLKTGLRYKDPNAIGAAYNMKSRLALNQNNSTLALQYMMRSLDYYLEINNKQQLLSCYNALGMIHQKRGEDDEAYHYFELSLQIAEEIDNLAKHSIRMNLGHILYGQKKYLEALEINFKSLEYFREQDMKAFEATALLNIGLCYAYSGGFEQAVQYLKESHALRTYITNPNDISTICLGLTTTLINIGDPADALPYLEEAMNLADTNNLKWLQADCYKAFSSYYEAMENLPESLRYLKRYIDLNADITQENNQEKITELEAKYKTQIYKLKSTELDEKNKAMSNQIAELNSTLQNLQLTHRQLQEEFQAAANRINTQDDLLSSQSRMAVMGEMVSSIAHQWRQPLNIVGILAQSIGDAWDFEELNDEFLKKQLELISGQIQYMNETINDFRNFFKPEFIKEFNLKDVITRSLQLLDFTLKNAQVTIVTEFEDDCRSSGNPNEIVQVLLNIINNAREAMQENNIPDPLIRITLQQQEEQIIIGIFNKGPQLSEETRAKLFEPYFTTKDKDGTGIGLYISRLIIENKFQGKLEMKNLGDGVEFSIILPSVI
ncbi:MAG: tetratricopeptide repeat protein [Candidatus Cloacimonetes bacterium]|nr:tetratricopeptide repeat protein [Candidatus Cloacimonadota bacterium]